MLALIFCLFLQEEDALRRAQTDLEACVSKQGLLTLGGVSEVLALATNQVAFFADEKKFKEAAAVGARANDALIASLSLLERKSPELRRVLLHLERGARRAASRESDEKKMWAYRTGFDKAGLEHQLETAVLRALVSMGLGYFRGGQHEDAEEVLKEVEERLPAIIGSDLSVVDRNARLAPILLGQNYFAQGKYAEAGACVRRGVALVPDWGEEDVLLKDLHPANADYPAMIKRLEEHVEARPADGDARFFLGYACFFSDQRERAKAVFESLLEKNKDDAGAKYFLERLKE